MKRLPKGMFQRCTVPGCDRPHLARGWCSRHWQRWKRHGDPLGGRDYADAQAYFKGVVLPHLGDGCLDWPYGSGSHGYGVLGKQPILVHRLVCEHIHGPAPSPKHEVAHSCGNRLCVNAAHLRWATHTENEADKLLHGIKRGRYPHHGQQQLHQLR